MNYIETCTKIAVFLWRSSNYRPLTSVLHVRPGWIIYQNMRETWEKKSHEVWTRNSNRSRCTAKKMTGGGHKGPPPPPPMGLGLTMPKCASWRIFSMSFCRLWGSTRRRLQLTLCKISEMGGGHMKLCFCHLAIRFIWVRGQSQFLFWIAPTRAQHYAINGLHIHTTWCTIIITSWASRENSA